MEKHGVERKLKGFLTEETVQEAGEDWWRSMLGYMKTLSPSGVELEIMNLTSFDFSNEMQANANYYVSYSKIFLLVRRLYSRSASPIVPLHISCRTRS